MPTGTRTYGRKQATKRKASPTANEEPELVITRKRRRLTDSAAQTTDLDTALQQEALDTATSQLPHAKSTSPSPSAPIPLKNVIIPSSSSTPANTPRKLSKRMLGRSKTESSIESHSSPGTLLPSRTPSLPVLLPSSSLFDNLPPNDSRPPLRPSTSTPKVKRTYAGASRSFLISLPVGDIDPNALHNVTREDDEFFEPESYSSLCQRWGMDNSEDDPVVSQPTTPSKSKSKSNSNVSSPRYKGKGKAKPPTPAVYLPPGMMNPLKSITELRSKGESRRFLDEVGYLLEGMEPTNGMGLRRSSALEITTKLCDEDFARKAKATDFFRRTWKAFLHAGAGNGEDKILDILLAFLTALIARDSDSLLDLAQPGYSSDTEESVSSDSRNRETKGKDSHPQSLIDILFAILDNSKNADPLEMASPSNPTTAFEFKQIGISKRDRVVLSSIHSSISRQSGLFGSDTPITTPLLVTHTLRRLPSSLIPFKNLPSLISSLQNTLTRSSISGSSLPIPSSESVEIHYECIRNHLHLLDMYLLGQWNNYPLAKTYGEYHNKNKEIMRTAREDWLVDDLITVGICTETRLTHDLAARDCLEVLLRILVNVTHGDEQWGERVLANQFAVNFLIRILTTFCLHSLQSTPRDKKTTRHEEVKQEGEAADDDEKGVLHSNYALDSLCLALGLLTNLVQSVPRFKGMLQQTRLDPACMHPYTTCIKRCSCPGSLNSLEIMVRIYYAQPLFPSIQNGIEPDSARHSPVEDLHTLAVSLDADVSLIQGHLAILFGLLMHNSPPNQEYILEALTTSSSLPSSSLSNAHSPHRKITPKAALSRLADQAREFVTFYDVLDSNHVAVLGEAGNEEIDSNGKVAEEVIRFLEELRGRL